MANKYCFVPANEHDFPDHPENPGRFALLDLSAIPDIEELPYEAATYADVNRVHSGSMLNSLENACKRGARLVDSAPTYVTTGSYRSALEAAGATLAVTRSVVRGETSGGFAIVRPPGHHAEPGKPMGFCLLNNAAITSMDALENGIERVMVVDIDAHHGNGTEKAFSANPRTAYFSMHQENIYPGSGWLKDYPVAKGRIANFPLPAYSGDVCFDRIISQALSPFIATFHPGLLIVSMGFDAHHSDPLTSLGLSMAGFYSISRQLVNLAGEFCSGKIVFVLEGGYDPLNVASGIQAVFSALKGMDAPPVKDPSPYPEPDISARIESFGKWHNL